MKHKSLYIIFFSLCLGCGVKEPVIHAPPYQGNGPKKIAVFFDGTTNNENSYTNVSKLYNLTTLQNNPNINAVYLRGVGNGADVLGKITGSGIRREVCRGYLFLAEHYNKDRKDEIYLFGFSRGAYAARILAGLVYVAGIVDIDQIPEKERLKFIKKIFDAHKSDKTIDEKRKSVFEITNQAIITDNVFIEFMGLWDTVAALGIPKYSEEYYVPNQEYTDQLCNVKKAVQALSLNDNRSTIFTPVMLTQKQLVKNCKTINPKDITNEVWFFGAHSDVGGGYKNSFISGVSLNWMIKELEPYQLLPKEVSVYENKFDNTNNPAKGFAKVFFPDTSRKLAHLISRYGYKKEKLKIHQSVIDKLQSPLQTYEINLIKFFSECFEENDRGGYRYIQDSNCFTIVQ